MIFRRTKPLVSARLLVSVLLPLGFLSAIGILLLSLILKNHSVALSVSSVRGTAADLWADIILGQPDFSEGTIKEKMAFKVNNPGGVIVDRSTSPNRVYVSDNANSRILGYSSLGVCSNIPETSCTNDSDCGGGTCNLTVNRNASVVIGQPDFARSACNGDSGYQNYPQRATPSASTLCGMPEVQISPLEGGAFVNMAVDAASNLYYPDWLNNRVLKYNDPLTSDAVADSVWGQESFASQECNRGQGLPSNNNLCFGNNTSYNPAFVMGVDVDSTGNLWVADVLNNRVLRFPYNPATGEPEKTADLVLGQPDFVSKTGGSGASQMRYPGALRADASGKVYVADTQNNRVLVFSPPFTNGMNGTLWGGNFNYPSGVEIDSKNGGIWINDTGNHMVELWNYEGTSVLKVLYKDVYNLEPLPDPWPVCNSPVGVCYQDHSLGSIGITSDGDLFVASSSNNQDVVRFKYPIASPTPGVFVPADFRLYYPPERHNYLTGRSLLGPLGVDVANGQLIVSDSSRILFWNNPPIANNFREADGVVGPADFYSEDPNNYGRLKADKAGHLFVAHKYQIEIFNLPLSNGEVPAKTISGVIKNLEGQDVDLTEGGDFVVGGLWPSDNGSYFWVAQNFSNRVIRIRNPLTTPVVDAILGQTSPTGISCNQGGAATLSTLCSPGAVVADKKGNLYVSDNSLEVSGNGRLLEWDSLRLPTGNTSTLYAPAADRLLLSHHVFQPAFDSGNRMVVGYNAYNWANARHSLDYFEDILTNTTPTAPFNDFYSMPYSMVFDENDNLYVTDINRWKVAYYKRPITPTPTTTLYLSFLSAQTLGGTSFANEDIASFDGTNFSMYFDGSDVGLGAFTIDAFSIISPTEILLSFRAAGNVPNVGSVDDSDIIKFTATSLGATTAGTFSWYFDGSDIGLTLDSEDVDAVEVLGDGTLLISTFGIFGVNGFSGADEDVIRCSGGTRGAASSCTAISLYFDGSDVGLSGSKEDVDALSVNGGGNIYLSSEANFSVNGLSGADEDVFVCQNPVTGPNSSCGSWSLFFDGSSFGLSANDVVGIELP